jgi:hypothetical protein
MDICLYIQQLPRQGDALPLNTLNTKLVVFVVGQDECLALNMILDKQSWLIR